MKKTRCLLLAVAVAAMAFTFSCSSDDGEERDSRLFCNDGEAWISTYYGDQGTIFYQNGNLDDVQKSGSNWYFISYEDEGLKSITWSTSGGELILHVTSTDGRKAAIGGPYRIKGDTLELEVMSMSGKFTKKTGIYPEW